MASYIWVWIGCWLLAGVMALCMNIYEHPALQENIGWAEVWPVLFGPLWLFVKLGSWFVWGGV
jgi:hypothetical protein